MDAKPSSASSWNSGFYQLAIRLDEERTLEVGRLGRFAFPAGYYVYTGSAKKGLDARIARHLRSEKRVRWHIDYLLDVAAVTAVRRYDMRHDECALSRSVVTSLGGVVVAPGFGSSDCRCITHLYLLAQNPVKGGEWEDGGRKSCVPAR